MAALRPRAGGVGRAVGTWLSRRSVPAVGRTLGVLAAAVVMLAGTTGCGGPDGTAEVEAPVPMNAAAPPQDGAATTPDTSTREAQAGGRQPTEVPEEERSSPSLRADLRPAEQPEKAFRRPDFPGGPAEAASEKDRLEYELAKVVWTAAGVVDEDADTDCGVDESTLIKVGDYSFDCEVSSSGVTVELAVNAEVTSDTMRWKYRVSRLPIAETKAVYEATRQSFKPARVTCDIVGVELVRVEKTDGLTCWVTDVHNQRTAYHGQLLSDESSPLVFRPVES